MIERLYGPVSVIIPAYCCEKTIQRAISSIWAQTLLPKEIIVVDDCSHDQTRETIQNISAEFPFGWIKAIFLESNVGPATARNIGWDLATSKYIAFLDADDSWHPQKIELQYLWMEAHAHVALLAHKYEVLSESDGPRDSVEFELDELRCKSVGPWSLLCANKFSTPTVMVRNEIPYRFEGGKRYAEDYLLWLQICLGGGGCWIINLPLAFLHKAPFGDSGLSSHLAKMQMGEFRVYLTLHKTGFLGFFPLVFFILYSAMKFVRRLVLLERK